MTVAVSCNLSDGVILGVDSAVSIATQQGVAKVYENAEKLFQFGDRPIGVAIYGIAALGTRGIGSYLREFEVLDVDGVVSVPTELPVVVESLRHFFFDKYMAEVVPILEREHGQPFANLTPDQIPVLGLVVGGFSPGAFLSEVWEIQIPTHGGVNSATLLRPQGNFGANWFAIVEPIRRYHKGFDKNLIEELANWFVSKLGRPFTPAEQVEAQQIVNRHEYGVPFPAMPMYEGVQYVRFLVELVVNHHKYVVGPSVVGGKAQIGMVTYRGEQFQILDEIIRMRKHEGV